MGTDLSNLRQWLLLVTLAHRRNGMTVRELADELEVSDKTIRRALKTFTTLGIPILDRSGDYGRKTYRLDPDWALPDLRFTADEAAAMFIGRRYLEPLAGTSLWEAAQRACQKIQATLGERALKHLERATAGYHETPFGVSDYSGQMHILDTLFAGMRKGRVVFITYRSQNATESVTYDIHPYRFARHLGSLYLFGYKPDDSDLRTWRVDRIEAAGLEKMPFTVRDDIDVAIQLAGKPLKLLDRVLRIGVPQARAMVPAAALRARLVTIKLKEAGEDNAALSEERFLEAARRQLGQLGVSSEAILTAGKRRTLRIKGKEIVGYEIILEGLNAEESLDIQERGIGGRRAMGCGVFVPIR